MSDNIVEGNETFNMSLTVPSSLGPGIVAGTVTSATGIIVDSTGKDFYRLSLRVFANCISFY